MCGIAGRFNYLTGAPVPARLVGRMCDLIAHRGPDGDGVWTDGPVGLGHRRLAIIDLSPGGRQPMTSADGELTITFNGEIYNFLELRRELEQKGHRFRSRSAGDGPRDETWLHRWPPGVSSGSHSEETLRDREQPDGRRHQRKVLNPPKR